MTGRAILKRRVRRWTVPVQIGSGLCLVGAAGYALTEEPAWFLLWVPGFPVALLALASLALFGVRCPWCRADLKRLLFEGWSFDFDPRVRCCPYCGHGLDEPLHPRASGAGAEER